MLTETVPEIAGRRIFREHLVMRETGGDPSFRGLIERVRERGVRAYSHQPCR